VPTGIWQNIVLAVLLVLQAYTVHVRATMALRREH